MRTQREEIKERFLEDRKFDDSNFVTLAALFQSLDFFFFFRNVCEVLNGALFFVPLPRLFQSSSEYLVILHFTILRPFDFFLSTRIFEPWQQHGALKVFFKPSHLTDLPFLHNFCRDEWGTVSGNGRIIIIYKDLFSRVQINFYRT